MFISIMAFEIGVNGQRESKELKKKFVNGKEWKDCFLRLTSV